MKSRIRLLVADDEPRIFQEIRNAISTKDEIAEFEILTASTPQEALNIVMLDDPHVCVLDLNYQETTHSRIPEEGLELIEKISEVSDAGLIILSGYPDDVFMPKTLQRGADFYIEKVHAGLSRQKMFVFCLRRCANYYYERQVQIKVESPIHNIGDFKFSIGHQKLSSEKYEDRKLTYLEYHLLNLLLSSQSRMKSVSSIYKELYSDEFVDGNKRLSNVIKRLNKKVRPSVTIEVGGGICSLMEFSA